MPRYRLAFERYHNTDRPLQFFQMNYRVVAGGRTISLVFKREAKERTQFGSGTQASPKADWFKLRESFDDKHTY